MNRRYNRISCLRRQEVSTINPPTLPRYRNSRVRSGILEFLHTSLNHPSAEDVHYAVKERFPKVSFGTVYRNLNILVDQGEAQRLESSRGKDRFDGRRPFHAHFRCDQCGIVFDLPLTPEKLTRDLSAKTGHQITSHNIEFSGTCSHCTSGS